MDLIIHFSQNLFYRFLPRFRKGQYCFFSAPKTEWPQPAPQLPNLSNSQKERQMHLQWPKRSARRATIVGFHDHAVPDVPAASVSGFWFQARVHRDQKHHSAKYLTCSAVFQFLFPMPSVLRIADRHSARLLQAVSQHLFSARTIPPGVISIEGLSRHFSTQHQREEFLNSSLAQTL